MQVKYRDKLSFSYPNIKKRTESLVGRFCVEEKKIISTKLKTERETGNLSEAKN